MKKASIITYGCQMNVNESAKIKKIFQNLGYDVTEEIDNADAVFLNTCTVREGAATQIFGKLGELKALKEKRGTIIGVTGCFAQEQGEELVKKFPIIDIVMGNQNIGRIPQAIEKIENNESTHEVYTDNEDELPPRLDAEFGSDQTASISITYGCNNFCTFCIVPYVRGRERSVPLEEIVKDVEQYVKKGAKEIVLLGQNVNSYGKDFKNGDNFAKLLDEICKVEGDYIVRFVSPHPRDFTDDVIDVIANSKHICKLIHMPLQAGSSNVLKKMNRNYTKEEYLKLVDRIRSKIPDATFTTDIIVGFPGETEEDFEDTLDVVRKVRYEQIYMFIYSRRIGTVADTMEDQIPEDIKHKRFDKLKKLTEEIIAEDGNKYIGTIQKVLVEGTSKNNDEVLTGRTDSYKVVNFKGDKILIGKMVDVKIDENHIWYLSGFCDNI